MLPKASGLGHRLVRGARPPSMISPPSNTRLKLAGLIVFKGGRCVVAPVRTVYRSAMGAPAGRDARSLSAIR
jgi:hypothetical protein